MDSLPILRLRVQSKQSGLNAPREINPAASLVNMLTRSMLIQKQDELRGVVRARGGHEAEQ